MGFLGCGDERLIIESRFSGEGNDLFFQYLLDKVLDFPNIVDLKADANQDNRLFNFLLFLSALRGVPVDRKGAARVDGANERQVWWHVTLPAILPTVVYVSATNAILALMTSGPVMIITQGGPARATTTLIYMMYTSGYASGNDALAACISLVSFALAFAFTFLALRFEKRKAGV